MPSRTLRDLVAGSLFGLSLCVSASAQDLHPSSVPPGPGGNPPPGAVITEAPVTSPAPFVVSDPNTVFVEPGCNTGLYVVAETVFLDRDTPDQLLTATNGLGPGRPPGIGVMSGDNLEFEMEAGVRLTLGYQYDADSAIEGTFTGFLDWNTKSSVGSQLPELAAAFPTPFVGLDPFDLSQGQAARYSSNLLMVETNHISRVGQRGTFLVGARYIDLEEEFELTAFGPLGAGEIDVKTRNYMVGPQIGGSYEWCLCRRLTLDVSGKFGVLANLFDVGTNVVATGTPSLNDRENDVELATVTDLGATLRYRFTNSLTFQGGYQVLVINGAALAIEQEYESTNTGNAVYHGPNVGFEWRR